MSISYSKKHREIDSQRRTIIVFGSPRGGTSLVSGVLREMGIFMGSGLGENHEDPLFLSRNGNELRDAVNMRNEKYDIWGWKVPHSLYYLDSYLDLLVNPLFVVVFRNIHSIGMSQVKRADGDYVEGLRVALNYYSTILSRMEKIGEPVLYLGHEAILSQKMEFLESLSKFVGVKLSPRVITNCLEFIDPNKGYRMTSFNDLQVYPVGEDEMGSIELELSSLQHSNVDFFEKKFIVSTSGSKGHVFIPFITKTIIIELSNDVSAESTVKTVEVIPNYGEGYSNNLREVVEISSVKSYFRLESDFATSILIRFEEDIELRLSVSQIGDVINRKKRHLKNEGDKGVPLGLDPIAMNLVRRLNISMDDLYSITNNLQLVSKLYSNEIYVTKLFDIFNSSDLQRAVLLNILNEGKAINDLLDEVNLDLESVQSLVSIGNTNGLFEGYCAEMLMNIKAPIRILTHQRSGLVKLIGTNNAVTVMPVAQDDFIVPENEILCDLVLLHKSSGNYGEASLLRWLERAYVMLKPGGSIILAGNGEAAVRYWTAVRNQPLSRQNIRLTRINEGGFHFLKSPNHFQDRDTDNLIDWDDWGVSCFGYKWLDSVLSSFNGLTLIAHHKDALSDRKDLYIINKK